MKFEVHNVVSCLGMKVMVKSGQCDKAWRYYEIMERGGFLPSALTFKGLFYQPYFDTVARTT